MIPMSNCAALSTALVACALHAVAAPVSAQQPVTTDTLFTRALEGVRSAARPTDCGLTGDGGFSITSAARASQFTVLGEAHGVNDVPKFAAALFCDLTRHGYRHLAIEVSPVWGRELSRQSASPGGIDAIRRTVERHYPGVAFYTLREEAELLVKASRAAGGGADAIWGIDYDVMPEGLLIHRLEELADRAAKPAVDRLRSVAESLHTAALALSSPGRVFAFGGSRALVDSVRRAMRPRPGSEPDRLLALLETTLMINNEWTAGRGYESNVLRSENLRRNFAMHYAAATARDRTPKAMIKLGASHAYRGRGLVNTYDVGALVPELATMNGTSSVGILAMGGPGSSQASFDPRTFSYVATPNVYANTAWTRPFYALADSASWTVFDLRALRARATSGSLGPLPAATLQAVFGFDFLVILGGSKPSEPLPLVRPGWASIR
jgi:hypothetical protein